MALPPVAMVQQSSFIPMRALRAFSIGLSAIALIASLGANEKAYAADAALFVDQKSAISEYGHWTLTLPGDATFQSALKTKLLNNLTPGSYGISVVSPAGALTKLTLVKSGTAMRTVNGTTMNFEITDDHTYRINIEYIYAGTVKVTSNPSNVGFVMTNLADNTTYTGTTPATFDNMSPVEYRVQYNIEPACEVQKTLRRELIHRSVLTLYRDFTCGDRRIPTSGRTAQPLATKPMPAKTTAANTHTDSPDKSVVQTASMSEVVPGGLIHFTITVKNVARETLHNVNVIDRYNPEAIDIVQPLLHDGSVNGNQIEWYVPQIYAGPSWTTTFTARAKDHLVAGDRIVLMANANSTESDVGLYPEAWSSVVGVGVAYMPQTGDRYDALFAIGALMGAALITNLTIRRKQSVV